MHNISQCKASDICHGQFIIKHFSYTGHSLISEGHQCWAGMSIDQDPKWLLVVESEGWSVDRKKNGSVPPTGVFCQDFKWVWKKIQRQRLQVKTRPSRHLDFSLVEPQWRAPQNSQGFTTIRKNEKKNTACFKLICLWWPVTHNNNKKIEALIC